MTGIKCANAIPEAEVIKRAEEMIASGEPLTNKTFQKYKLGDKIVKRVWGGREGFYKAFDIDRPRAKGNPYSEDEIAEELKRLYDENGDITESLINEKCPFSYALVHKHGGLEHFCNKLGISKRIPHIYTEEEVKQALLEVYNKYGIITRPVIEKHCTVSMTAIQKWHSLREWRKILGVHTEGEQGKWLDYFEKCSGVKLQREVKFETCINESTGAQMPFDGYSEEHNLLIEFNDISHYRQIDVYSNVTLEERQRRDAYKKQWAEEHGFNFISVSTMDNPFGTEYMNGILDKLKLFDRTRPTEQASAPTSEYTGVYRGSDGSFHTSIKCDLYSSADDKRCALYRDGYARTHGIPVYLNNFTDDDYREYGLESYEDYALLRTDIGKLAIIQRVMELLEEKFTTGYENGMYTVSRIYDKNTNISETQFIKFTFNSHEFDEFIPAAESMRKSGTNLILFNLDLDNIRIDYTHEELTHSLERIKASEIKGYSARTFSNEITDFYNQNTFFSEQKRFLAESDADHVARYIVNRIMYAGNPSGKGIQIITPARMLRGLDICRKVPLMSGHNVNNIRNFIRTYGITSVADPFAGWGQRMIGAACEGVFYQGCEVSFAQYMNLKSIAGFLCLEGDIYRSDAEKVKFRYPYDGVFTCPPYYHDEHYSDEGMENLDFESFGNKLISIFRNIGAGVPVGIQFSSRYECIMDALGEYEREPVVSKVSPVTSNNRKDNEYVYIFPHGVSMCKPFNPDAYASCGDKKEIYYGPSVPSETSDNRAGKRQTDVNTETVYDDMRRIFSEHGNLNAKLVKEYSRFSLSTVTKFYKLSALKKEFGYKNIKKIDNWCAILDRMGIQFERNVTVSDEAYDVFIRNASVAITFTGGAKHVDGLTVLYVDLKSKSVWTQTGIRKLFEDTQVKVGNTKRSYKGVYRFSGSYGYFSGVITVNKENTFLIQSKDEKLAAMYREGYIRDHNLKCGLNGFTDDDYKEYGLDSWKDYPKLKFMDGKHNGVQTCAMKD